ncbi:MAG: hypothetical protein DWI22_02585 [Planctomycetota bacterium]|jgi:hypothetical protein|nr:MAG: hypothetical protein DWI22_02585 [Planctomycetota bacterium]
MQQPKLTINLSEGDREGRPETVAEVVSEYAGQQADGTGRRNWKKLSQLTSFAGGWATLRR